MNAVSVADEHGAKFRCHDYYFSLSVEELTKIPYLETLANAKDFKEKPDSNGIISLNTAFCDPDLIKVVIKYIKTDRARCLFSDLPDNSDPSKLFELLDYLCVAKPKCSLAELDKKLKNLTSVQDKYGNYFEKSDRSSARDACVKLCWSGRELVGPKDQSKFYNMVLFIISHPRTFYLRLRQVTFKWYLQYFQITDKQRTILQNWLDKCDGDAKKSYSDEEKSSSGGSSSDVSYCSDSD